MAYQWDARGRLVQVTIYASGSDYLANPKVPKEIVDYTYDMFNNLIGRTDTTYAGGIQTGSTTQCYVYDGANPVLAFNGGGCLTDRYLFGPAVDQVLADEYFGGSTTLYPTTYGSAFWALTDSQNSVTDIVDDLGCAVEHIDYSPFGLPSPEDVVSETYNPWGSELPKGYNFPFGFTGTYTDPVTNLQLHGLRWCSPLSQRWLSEDPSALARDPNLYRYCSNSPVNVTDPNGQWGVADDALAMGTGFVYGVVGQGVGDLLSGHLSSWENYVGAGVGGAAAAETMLYTANPVLAGMASGAASNATTQALLMAENKQQNFELATFAMATGMGGAGALVGSMMNNATAPLGRMLSNGLQGSLPLSPETSCYIVSTLMSGVNGMLTGGVLGGMMGGFQGYISHGWEGVLDGMYAGMAKGAGQGLANGLIMAAIDPFICFTAGTLVHKASGKEVIESLRVGQRTLTEDTKDSADLPGDDPTEVDPRTWRLVQVRTAKPAGSANLVDVELLRPLAWIEQTRALVGSQIHFELAELGIDGPACVLAIEPCPEIERSRGRVITGTFTTARCGVLDLRLSSGEVLEPTPPHRFFSDTRQDWVAAEKLRVGECLRTASGPAVTVESIALKAGEHRVYNLEVEQEHQFYVGESGVLVHNSYTRQDRVVSRHYSSSPREPRCTRRRKRTEAYTRTAQNEIRNFAAANVVVDGVEKTVVFTNVPGVEHSEQRLIRWSNLLADRGSSVEVRRVYTERPPCGENWANCTNQLAGKFGSDLNVYHGDR